MWCLLLDVCGQEEVGEIIWFTLFKAPQNGANRRIEEDNKLSNLGKLSNNATTVSGKAGNQLGNHSQANWRTELQTHVCQVGAKIADCQNEEKHKGNVAATFRPVWDWRWWFFEEFHYGRWRWVTHFDPELEETSKEYCHCSSLRHKKIKSERATGKLMLSIFWDVKGVIYGEFLPEGSTVNSVS